MSPKRNGVAADPSAGSTIQIPAGGAARSGPAALLIVLSTLLGQETPAPGNEEPKLR